MAGRRWPADTAAASPRLTTPPTAVSTPGDSVGESGRGRGSTVSAAVSSAPTRYR